MRFSNLPKKVLLSYIGLLGANLIWAAATPIIRLTLEYIPPYTFLFLRFLIVSIILLPYVIYMTQRYKIHRKDILNIVLLGLFSQSSIIILFVALKYTTSIDATIIGILGPLFSMVAGHYFYKDKFNSKVKTGIIITLLGAFFVIIEPLYSPHVSGEINILARIYGNILVLFYNLAFLLYIIWSKISLGQTTKIIKKALHFIHLRPMSKEYPPNLITALTFYVGLATMIPMALMERLSGSTFDPTTVGFKGLAGLLYMAIFSSIVAYFAFEKSLDNVTVSDTALICYLAPLMTIPFSYLLLKEIPTIFIAIGSIVIFIGVFLAEMGAHEREKRAE